MVALTESVPAVVLVSEAAVAVVDPGARALAVGPASAGLGE